MNLADGTVSTPAVTDMSSGGYGQSFGLTRVWTDRLVDQLTPGVFGNGWVSSALPTLFLAGSTVIANVDGNGSLYFDNVPAVPASGGNPAVPAHYQERFFGHETLTTAGSGAGATYTLIDSVGDTLTFIGFDPSINLHARGQLQSFTDPSGNVTTYTWSTSTGQLASIKRGGTGAEEWDFTYVTGSAVASRDPFNVTAAQDPTSDLNDDTPMEVEDVTLSRGGSQVERVAYSYYAQGDATNDNGGWNDLKTAILQDASNNPLGTYYYRYNSGQVNEFGLSGSLIATADTLRMIVTPADYARLQNDYGSAAGQEDTVASGYAAYVIGYASNNTVGSVSDITSGDFYYNFTPAANPGVGTDIWANSVQIQLPGNSFETEFANYGGEMMGTAMRPTQTAGVWQTAYVYDPQGRLTLTAMPSAVTVLKPSLPDLIGKQSDGGYSQLYTASGLIDQTTYGQGTSATASAAGDVQGFASGQYELHGGEALADGGGEDAVNDGFGVEDSTTQYLSHASGGNTIYVLGSTTVYGDANGNNPQTVYSYQPVAKLQNSAP